jgi:ornithine cyclodeaminase
MLLLNATDVRKALPMRAAVEAMKTAYGALSSGRAEVPLRGQLPVPPHNGVALIMPAFVQSSDEAEAMAIKVVSVFPNNREMGLATIHAAVLVLEAKTGKPIAILEGGSLTAIRTGAASGAATDILARPDSQRAAIFGAGVQARTQLEAVCTVRPVSTVWVYDPEPKQVHAFIEEMAGRDPIPEDLRAAADPEEAIRAADIICTATTATSPVFPNEALRPGTHINGVGSYTPEMIEVPPETAARANVFVDSREAVMEEAGELIAAVNHKLLLKDDLTELGEVVIGESPGRATVDEITFFKSVGVAVQDALAADLALQNAQEMQLGEQVPW